MGDSGQARRWRKYKARFATLPNILVGDALIPEILDTRPRIDEVIAELAALLADPSEMDRQREGFARIRAGMEKGAPDAPLTNAAERVIAHLTQRLPTAT